MAMHRDPGTSRLMALQGHWDFACCGVGQSMLIVVERSALMHGSRSWLVLLEAVSMRENE
eukprot:3409526-Lingulodinium_polyedra.AAC.1